MTMTDLLYGLSFLPLLLIVLTIHEAGHYWLAHGCKLRIGSFQIGLGPTLYHWYRGKATVEWNNEVPDLRKAATPVKPGRVVRLAVATTNEGKAAGKKRATAILPANKRDNPNEESRLDQLRQHNQESLQITGQVREVSESKLTLAPTAFSLRPIPIAAGVTLPEDPSREAKDTYNTAPWRQRILVILAGPAANIVLFLGALALMSVLPTASGAALLEVTEVTTGSQAERAGMEGGDRILRVDEELAPRPETLKATLARNKEKDTPTEIELSRAGKVTTLSVPPELVPAAGEIWGLTLEASRDETGKSLPTPDQARNRFLHLNQVYLGAFKGLIQEGRAADSVSGPIMAVYQTTKAIELAGLQAWLAVLALISLSAALVNLLPIPPLDGYQAMVQTLKSLRKGKELSPRLEGALAFYGISLLVLLTLALTARDIYQLTS